LNPSVPFYRYVRTWRRNEERYLRRDVAIATVFGRQLTSDELRQRQELNARRLLPVRMPERANGYELSTAPRHGYRSATVTFTLSGRQTTFDLSPGDSVLTGALQVRSDTPYGCMGGACGTCRAKLLSGTVEMDQNFWLGPAELDAGYVLTCQAHPTSPTVAIDYDT
jgi:ferredoxin